MWWVCFVFSSPSNFASCFHNDFFLQKLKWHPPSSCHSSTFTTLTGSFSFDLWTGRSSGHRFPRKLSLAVPNQFPHSLSIPWALVSAYREDFQIVNHVKIQTGQHSGSLGTLPSRTDSKLTFSQATCRSSRKAGRVVRLLNRPLHYPGLEYIFLTCSYSETIELIDVATEIPEACGVHDNGWAQDIQYFKVLK